MGQTPSKVQKNQSATASLKRVSKLFHPGMKRDQPASGASNVSSQPPPSGEDASTQHPAGGVPEEENQPAGGAGDKV